MEKKLDRIIELLTQLNNKFPHINCKHCHTTPCICPAEPTNLYSKFHENFQEHIDRTDRLIVEIGSTGPVNINCGCDENCGCNHSQK